MKRSYLIWAIAGLLASCSNEDLGVGLKVDNHVVHASFEQLIPKSRVGFDGDNGYAFFWTKDDELSVYTTNASNPWAEHTIVEGGVGKATADFTGTLIGEGTKTSTCAVYPFNEMHSLSGSTLSFYMPDSYTYTGNDDDFGQTNNATNVPMLAKIENEGSKDFAFKHLGGMFAFKIANIPAGANKFVFTVDKKINGSFNVDLNADEPVIVATETTVDDERTVTINFPASETIATRVFYIPVPTTAEGDSYGRFSVSLYKNQTEMWSFISSVTTSNVVTRKKLLYAPVLACSTVSGGEGVDSEEELKLALASSEGMGSVILSGSFALESELEISSGKNIAIDLNNQTLTVGNGASTFSGRAAATTGPVGIKNSGTLTLKNGTISGTSMQNIIANLEDAELRLENVTITHTWEQGYVSYTYSDGNEHAAILNKKGVVELINVNITSDLACVYTIGDWDNNGGSLDDQRAAGQTVKTIIEGGTMSSTANYAHTNGNKHTYAVQAVDNALTTIANVRISGEGGVSLNCSDAELTNAVFSVANCAGNDTYGLYLYSAGKMSWDETCNLGIVKAQIYNDKGAYKSADGSVIVNDVTINEQTEGVVSGAFGGKTWVSGESVNTSTDLQTKLAAGGAILLADNASLSASGLNVPSGIVSVLDLNGNELTVTDAITNNGTLIVKNGTIKGSNIQYVVENKENAILEMEDVTVNHTWGQGYVSYSDFTNFHSAVCNYKGVVTLADVNISSDVTCVYTVGAWDNSVGNLDAQRSAGQTIKTTIKGGTMSSTANYAHTGGNKHTYAVQAIDNALTTIANVRISGEGGVSLNCSDAELTNAVFSVANCTGNDTYGLYLYSAGKMSWDETCNLGIVKAQIYNDKGAYKSADGSVIVNDVTINEQTEGVVTGAFGGKTWDTGVATE